MKNTTTIEMNPLSKNTFLRFQVLRPETRPEMEPVYEKTPEGLRLIGHQPSGAVSRVSRLLGFGATKEAAEAMAESAS